MILQACDFLFYLASSEKHQYREGRRYCGIGTLLLDHYSWVECLADYDNPPNLFYNLEVKRILRVNVPEKFITRHERANRFQLDLFPAIIRFLMLESWIQWQGSHSTKSSISSSSMTRGLKEVLFRARSSRSRCRTSACSGLAITDCFAFACPTAANLSFLSYVPLSGSEMMPGHSQNCFRRQASVLARVSPSEGAFNKRSRPSWRFCSVALINSALADDKHTTPM